MRAAQLSTYLTGATFAALGDVFASAVEVRSWLQRCAGVIAKSGQAVEFHHLVGFPIQQPYRTERSKRVPTVLQVGCLQCSGGHA